MRSWVACMQDGLHAIAAGQMWLSIHISDGVVPATTLPGRVHAVSIDVQRSSA